MARQKSGLREFFRPRLKAAKAVLWRPVVKLVSVVYGVYGAVTTILQAASVEPAVLKWLPRLTLKGWVIGALAILLLAALEGAYRALATKDAEAVGLRSELAVMESQHVPKLALSVDEAIYSHSDTVDSVRICRAIVENKSDVPLQNVRVLIESFSPHWRFFFQPSRRRAARTFPALLDGH